MMKTEVILDRNGDLPVPPGYQIIESEVDFLRYATDDRPLLIRGERLCAWAEAFYALRKRPYRYQESLSAVLRRVFPELSPQHAVTLVRKIGMEAVSLDEVSAMWVLSHCYPDDLFIWRGEPSHEHAAHWLLWLCTHQPDDAESIILRHFAGLLTRNARDPLVAQVYRAVDPTQATALLDTWLGLGGNDLSGLGEFPIEVPSEILGGIRSKWMSRLIESNGTYFEKMLAFPLPLSLRQELARLAVDYYRQNPQHLTRQIIQQLQPFVATRERIELEKCLPPPEPAPLPAKEPDVLEWIQEQYLPYRHWQAHYGSEQDQQKVQSLGQAFARWYLTRYPQWLLEPGWLSFQQSAQLPTIARDKLTLCVILDGLPIWDAEDFAGKVSANIDRLQLQQKTYRFAPLPTVTEFAKDALLKGVPPHLAPQYKPLGSLLAENDLSIQQLEDHHPGDLIFWCVGQPDAAYHFGTEAQREERICAELDIILHRLHDIVENIAPQLALQIIVTTDHGRLLNPRSPRRLSLPKGMQAHGRIAWGKVDRQFDESGFLVDEEAGWIAVHGERFGMSYDMLIAWGEDSFQNENPGYESYPHGGLFPEEVIVPWFVFERDAQPPTLFVTITGKGEAEGTGKMNVQIRNQGRIALKCLEIALSHGACVTGDWPVPPLEEVHFDVPLKPWPAKNDLATLKANLLFQQPSGKTFTVKTSPSFEVAILYDRDESLLKELDL